MALLFVVVAVVLPLASWPPQTGEDQVDPVGQVLGVITIAVCALRLGATIAIGKPRIVQLAVWLFAYVAYGLAPLAQAHTGLSGVIIDRAFLPQSQFIVLLSLAAFEIGYAVRGRDSWRSGPANNVRIVSLSRLKVLTAVAFVTTAAFAAYAGGLTSFFTSRFEFRAAVAGGATASADSQATIAIVAGLGTIPILFAALGWAQFLMRDRDGRSAARILIATLTALLALIVNNPIVNPRYWVLTILVAVLFSAKNLSPRRIFAFAILGILAAVVVFPFADYFRNASEYRTTASFDSIAVNIASKDFDQLTMIGNGLAFVEENGFTKGRQLTGVLLFAVPRSVWPGKPVDTGVMIGEFLGVDNVNLSSPLQIELWTDFGWLGVVVGFAAVGWASARLDAAFSRTRSVDRVEPVLEDLLVPIIAGYSFILLRGPLLQSMSRLIMAVAIAYFLTRAYPARVGKSMARREPAAEPAASSGWHVSGSVTRNSTRSAARRSS